MTTIDGIAHGAVSSYNKGCRCEGCRTAKSEAGQRHYKRNREKILERNRKWARDNPEKAADGARRRRQRNPERHRAAVRRWRERNPERARLYELAQNAKPESKRRQRQWATENRDRVNAAAAKWRANPDNQEKIRQAAKRRRAAMNGADVRAVSARDWCRLMDRCGHACFYCGSSVSEITVDHIIPISRGGRHSIGNIVPACKRCNSSKHDRLLVEWRRPT